VLASRTVPVTWALPAAYLDCNARHSHGPLLPPTTLQLTRQAIGGVIVCVMTRPESLLCWRRRHIDHMVVTTATC